MQSSSGTHLLGDDSVALQVAEDAFDAAKLTRAHAYLWQRDATGEWTVAHVVPQLWVAQLGALIERQQGAPGRWSRYAKAAAANQEPS